MLGIQPLPTDVVHLMAAGEVIDSIAAAVRELVENALDANATRISISVSPEQWRVQVADNGCGMELADLQQAAAPHATSKIRDRQDLQNIHSLGFRGEALHSLTQLADLEVLSRPTTVESGWRVRYDHHGQAIAMEAAAIAPGTIVIANNLFGNWITRRQGLPAVNQQMKAVQATIHQIALCHPQVTWQVQQNDQPWFTLYPGKTVRDILPQILRDVRVGDLQEFREEREEGRGKREEGRGLDGQVEGVLGLPDRCHRHRLDWVRVAINGRRVQLPELEQTILTAFRRTLPRDRYPVCLVHLQVPPDQIDWNRHPAKAEVYLHHLQDWQDRVTKAIAQALQLNPASLPEPLYAQRVGNLLKTAESEGGYAVNRAISKLEQPLEIDSDSPPPHLLTPLRAVAQLHNTYLVVEHPAGVWLIEQHIAHERVLYEQVCDRWQLVPLEPPVILNHLTTAQLEQLERLGLEVESFGDQLWAVRSAPELLAQRVDCADALVELSLGGDLQTAQVATACRSAIRNGTPLTLEEMQTLLNQWQQTRNPAPAPTVVPSVYR